MAIDVRQSTASQEVPLGYFVDSTDGNTEETGLTIANTDIKIWKAGATTLANKNSGGGTHISNGIYYAVLDATDTNTIGPLVIFCHVSGALAVRVECRVLDEAVYDSLYGTTALSTYAGGDTSGTTTLLSRVVGTLASGTHTPQTGDAFARLGAPAGASVSADLLAIDNFVDDLESRIGTPSNLGSGATLAANLVDIEAQTDDIGVAGAGLTNIGTIATVTTLTNLPTIPANWLTAAGLATDAVTEIQSGLSTLTQANIRTAVGLASANLDTQLDALPTAAENADAVWDEATSGHATAGSTGKALTDAGSAGDPWSTALPGAYGAGTAGQIIGDNINAAISSRASQASLDTLDDYVDTEVAAIKAKTDQLTFTVANQLDANIQSVNDVTVNGNGQTGTEWGP